MIKSIDFPKFIEKVYETHEMQRYSRSFNGKVRLGDDDGSWLISYKNGTPETVEHVEGEVDSDIQFIATSDQWVKILEVTPPPFYNSASTANLYHGVKYNMKDIVTRQYSLMLQEIIRKLREFYNEIPEIEDPAPVEENIRFEDVTGHYVYLTIDGIEYRVYYEECGEGIPFLLQHTAGANGQEYRYLMNDPDFNKDFRFISYDLPYHGKSLPPENYPWWTHQYKLTLDFMLKFQDQLVKALKLERPAYMGCSMGGHLAPDLAYYRPDVYRACVGIGASLKTADETGDRSGSLNTLMYNYDNPQISNGFVESSNMAIVSLPPYSTPNSTHEVGWDYGNAYSGVFGGDLYYYSIDHNLSGKAQDIDTSKTKLILMTGTYDPGTPPQTTKMLHEQVKGSEMILMEGVGHYAMLEAYPTFKEYFLPVAAQIKAFK